MPGLHVHIKGTCVEHLLHSFESMLSVSPHFWGSFLVHSTNSMAEIVHSGVMKWGIYVV